MPLGQVDNEGNILRLGGAILNVWQTPDKNYLLIPEDPKANKRYKTATKQEALRLYNLVEQKDRTEFPKLPPQMTTEIEREDVSGLFLPQGSRTLGKFESMSQPNTFHYVIQYADGNIRCTCWPFIRKQACNHYEMIRSILAQGIEITEPVNVYYNRE